jgi:hypothetical protein
MAIWYILYLVIWYISPHFGIWTQKNLAALSATWDSATHHLSGPEQISDL